MGGVFGDDIFGIWSSTSTTQTTSNAGLGSIWQSWSGQTATTNIQSTGSIFQIWVSNSTTTQTTAYVNATTEPIWVRWQTASGRHGQQQLAGQQIYQARQTPHEAAEARRREEAYRETQKVEAERYRAAKDRAEGLLYENLSDEQRAEIKRSKFFVVQGGKTGRKYRINANGGLVANVHEIDDNGVVKRRLCAHIDHAANAPIFDHILAQKLMLEYAEESFLKVANDHGR